MTRTEWILIGFLAGLIVLTYIHTLLIHRKLNKLLRAMDETYYEASYELRNALDGTEPDYLKMDKINRLKMCQAIFSILGRAVSKS
jgi:hypothetical protein